MKQRIPDTFDGYTRRHTDRALDRLADDIKAHQCAEAFKPLADAAGAVLQKNAERGGEPVHISVPLKDVRKDIERKLEEAERWDGMA